MCIVGRAADFRLGMIGLDTSHVVEFTKRFNDPQDKNFIPGMRVVAAVKGGSEDMSEESLKRIPGFMATIQEKYGVKIVDSIDDLLKQVDGVMVESVDGRPHLEQALPALKAGSPSLLTNRWLGRCGTPLRFFVMAKKYNARRFLAGRLCAIIQICRRWRIPT